MKANELRNLSVEDLQKELVQLQTALFNARFQLNAQQLSTTHVVRQSRRDIARVMTVLSEKLRAQSEE